MFLCKQKILIQNTKKFNTCNINKEHFMVEVFCVLILHEVKVTYLLSVNFLESEDFSAFV